MNKTHLNITIDPFLLQEVRRKEDNLSGLIENLLRFHIDYKIDDNFQKLNVDDVAGEIIKLKEKLATLEEVKKSREFELSHDKRVWEEKMKKGIIKEIKLKETEKDV